MISFSIDLLKTTLKRIDNAFFSCKVTYQRTNDHASHGESRNTVASQEFIQQTSAEWIRRLHDVFGGPPPSVCIWTNLDQIRDTLSKMAGRNVGHLYFPAIPRADGRALGGGNDLTEVCNSSEDGCIKLIASTSNIVKPVKLTFNRIGSYLAEWSFFLLQAEGIPLCGLYPDSLTMPYEQVIELPNGRYEDIECLESGYINGPHGPEALPEGIRSLARYTKSGSFALFCKASIYNIGQARQIIGDTYDARHHTMSEAEFLNHVQSWAQRIP